MSLVILLAAQSVQGLVWSLVLGNPVIDMKDDGMSSGEETSPTSDSLEDITSDMEHPRNTRAKLQAAAAGSRPTRHHHGQVCRP